jgi:integrase
VEPPEGTVGAKVTAEIADALAELAEANPSVHALLGNLARAVVDSAGGPEQDRAFPELSDIRIADEPDGASAAKGKPMHRIHGPYRHYDKWLIKIVDRATRKATNETFATKEEADAVADRLRRVEKKQAGISVGKALDAYAVYMGEKGNKPRTIVTTSHRLRRLFRGTEKIAVAALSQATAEKLYAGLAAADGSAFAVDTKRNILNQAKTFLKWCKGKGWARINSLEHVQGMGKRKRGKPQLTIDEARKFLTTATVMAGEGDKGAVAAMMALIMGMRGSEIAERIVRNLDDGGRILWITDTKTQAGVRRLQVPDQLQPLLRTLVEGKGAGDRIFGQDRNRHWVLRGVHRVCRAAGVPVVPAHGLRGTHATLAVSAGATGNLVAAALGHESFTTTARHYAKAEAIQNAQQEQALRELAK